MGAYNEKHHCYSLFIESKRRETYLLPTILKRYCSSLSLNIHVPRADADCLLTFRASRARSSIQSEIYTLVIFFKAQHSKKLSVYSLGIEILQNYMLISRYSFPIFTAFLKENLCRRADKKNPPANATFWYHVKSQSSKKVLLFEKYSNYY